MNTLRAGPKLSKQFLFVNRNRILKSMALSTAASTSIGMVGSATLCEKDNSSILDKLKDLTSNPAEFDAGAELDKLGSVLGNQVRYVKLMLFQNILE